MSNQLTKKQAKEIAQAILKAKNIKYDEWLFDCHMQAIGENAAVLQNILQKTKIVMTKEEN